MAHAEQEHDNTIPIEVLQEILQTLEKARGFVRDRAYNSNLHFRIREASETITKMIGLQKEAPKPFWWKLYDGLIGRYIELRTQFRKQAVENKKLRSDLIDLGQRYWDATNRLYTLSETDVDKW